MFISYGTEGPNVLAAIWTVYPLSCSPPSASQVGLQTQSIPPELVKAAFGRSVEVSRMVAVEPRKRKFHEVVPYPPPSPLQPIFVSIPLPCLPGKASAATIRLLCSVTGSTERATWQDVTGSTPLELCQDIVHFSTKVMPVQDTCSGVRDILAYGHP